MSFRLADAIVLATVIASAPAAAQARTGAATGEEVQSAGGRSEIDLFLKQALENRDSWRRLGDFVLRERVQIELETPSGIPRYSFRGEYDWHVRKGIAARRPLRLDGVDLDENRSLAFEADWLRGEARRRKLPGHQETPPFLSDAYYFAEFNYELGRSYLAGRESVAGRKVVRIEFYPADHADDEYDRPFNRGFSKTSLVTFWIDPEARQIVQYTFDNPGFEFLPWRWLLRVEGLEATVKMTPIGDVWMPSRVTATGRVTTALGEFRINIVRELFDYREAETGARFVGPARPR